jgi:hypothetical protein
MNTTANNKMIAEFMGFEITHKINYVPSSLPNCMKNAEHLKTDNPENLPFDTDWRWLMPVVEKIGSLGSQVKIEINEGFPYCEILCYADGENIDEIREEADKAINACYAAVVEFIKWYNQQPK